MYFPTGLVLLLVAACQAGPISLAVYPDVPNAAAAPANNNLHGAPAQPIRINRGFDDNKKKRDSYIGGNLGGVVGGVNYPQQNHQDWPYYYNYQAAQVGPMAPVSQVAPIAASVYPVSAQRPVQPKTAYAVLPTHANRYPGGYYYGGH